MIKKLLLVLTVCMISLSFVGCENKRDCVEVYGKSGFVFDNTHIKTKAGYFYDKHEKFTVDENTIGVTIYFSNNDDESWDKDKGE